MKRFSIVIKDLENGNEIVNDETNIIIGAFDADEKGTAAMCFSDCDETEMVSTLCTVVHTIKNIFDENPELRPIVFDIIKKVEADKEGGEIE